MTRQRCQVRSKLLLRQVRVQGWLDSSSLVIGRVAVPKAERQVVDTVHDRDRSRKAGRWRSSTPLAEQLTQRHGALCRFSQLEDLGAETRSAEEANLLAYDGVRDKVAIVQSAKT